MVENRNPYQDYCCFDEGTNVVLVDDIATKSTDGIFHDHELGNDFKSNSLQLLLYRFCSRLIIL